MSLSCQRKVGVRVRVHARGCSVRVSAQIAEIVRGWSPAKDTVRSTGAALCCKRIRGTEYSYGTYLVTCHPLFYFASSAIIIIPNLLATLSLQVEGFTGLVGLHWVQ